MSVCRRCSHTPEIQSRLCFGPTGVFWTVLHLFAVLVQLKWSEQDVATLSFNATKTRRQPFSTAFCDKQSDLMRARQNTAAGDELLRSICILPFILLKHDLLQLFTSFCVFVNDCVNKQ